MFNYSIKKLEKNPSHPPEKDTNVVTKIRKNILLTTDIALAQN
jgi:hypothetical protein